MRNRDENKELAIKQKAIEIIAVQGLEGFGINKLARAANVSPGTIYMYYKDTEDAITKLCNDVSSEILESSLKGLKVNMSFADGLKLQWKNRYNFFKTDPLKVKFVEQVRYSPLYEKVTQILTVKYGVTLKEFIENAVKKNELVDLPFVMYWSLAFAPLYQLINFQSQAANIKDQSVNNKMLFDQMLAIVLKGLKP